jgi:hypothetical protein
MAENTLFERVKGMLGKPQPPQRAPGKPPRRPAGPSLPRPIDDEANPSSIQRIGRSVDGRELVMTLGFGTYLVDREAPTICYYNRGALAVIPTQELQNLQNALMAKRNVGSFGMHYVDLLNVATYELESRHSGHWKPPDMRQLAGDRPPVPRRSNIPDKENPSGITRVGRSVEGSELIMTLGLGTFIVSREVPNLRYYDRGREWDIPQAELAALIEQLLVKEDLGEFKYAYVDLLNVATYVFESRRARG